MQLAIEGRVLTFTIHEPDQEPYRRIRPLLGWARVDGESSPRRILMNPRLTPQGSVSRRVSILLPNGSWYFCDDAELSERALASTREHPLIVTTL